LILKLDAYGSVTWDKRIKHYINNGISIDFDKTFIRQTGDNGYIFVANTNTTGIPGMINHGGYDIYAAKLDNLGDVQWQNMYGGNSEDSFETVIQTLDGGFFVAGNTYSSDINGDSNAGLYLLKIDNQGNLQWQEKYSWWAHSVTVKESDNGYDLAIIVYDAAVFITIDRNGKLENNKEFNLFKINRESKIVPAGNNTYYIVTSLGPGESRRIIKIENNGNIIWNKEHNILWSSINSVTSTNDGGLAMTGDVTHAAFDVTLPIPVCKIKIADCPIDSICFPPRIVLDCNLLELDKYDSNLQVVKLNADGDPDWINEYEEDYGSNKPESGYCINQAQDSGFIIAGLAPTLVCSKYGIGYDLYFLKLDANGN
jgi:hypothetical protein